MKNPAASTCGDPALLRVLKNYDKKKEGYQTVEQTPPGTLFEIKGGRRFLKAEKIRTRYHCVETATGKQYLFSGLYEVKIVGNQDHL